MGSVDDSVVGYGITPVARLNLNHPSLNILKYSKFIDNLMSDRAGSSKLALTIYNFVLKNKNGVFNGALLSFGGS